MAQEKAILEKLGQDMAGTFRYVYTFFFGNILSFFRGAGGRGFALWA